MQVFAYGIELVRRSGLLALIWLVTAASLATGAQAAVVGVTGGAGAEGTGADTAATFTVHAGAAAPAGGIDVAFAIQSAGVGATQATATQDYRPPAFNHVTIPSGAEEATIEIPVVADTTDEPDQLFAVRLTGVTGDGASVDHTQDIATWTITNDDAPPVVSIADGYIGTTAATPLGEGTETVRQMVFEVTLSAASEKTVSVAYDATPGTAAAQITPGDLGDYQPPAPGHPRLTISAGNTSGKLFVPVIADALDEVDEVFTVALDAPQNATLGRAVAGGVILDDDGPAASVLDATVTEGAEGQSTAVDVPVILTQTSVQDVTLAVTTADATAIAPGDYEAVTPAQTLTIPAGRLTGSVRVTVYGDAVAEGDQHFQVRLVLTARSNATLAGATSTVTISDDDPSPAPGVSSVAVPEGNGGTTTATVTISLALPSERKLRVDYATQDLTATAGADYQGTTGTLEFQPGQTAQQVTVPIAADSALERDETFLVRAVDASTGLSAGAGVVTIVDDDLSAANIPTLSVTTVNVAEGDTGQRPATFTLRLDSAIPRDVSVRYSTANGRARAGKDYLPGAGTIVIAAGQTRATVTVMVLGDRVSERNEDFRLVLSAPVNARIARGGGLAFIADDDVGGGPITLGRSAHIKGKGSARRIALRTVLCLRSGNCPGVPIRWKVQQRGTIKIVVRAVSTRRTVRRLTLLTRTTHVKAGRGGVRVRVRGGATSRRLTRRVRARHAQRLEIRVTFVNTLGAQQAPVTFSLRI